MWRTTNAPHFLLSSCPLNYEYTQIPGDRKESFKNLFPAQTFPADSYFSRIQQLFYLLLSLGVVLLQAA